MISPKLLDFSPFFLLIFSPLVTADFLLLLELSGDGYSLLCSKKKPLRHNSFIPGHVTVQHYFRPFQVLFPTVLSYSFFPGHLFAVCGLFIAVKTIITCLLLFGSAQWEWDHLVNPQFCIALLPFPAPVAVRAVILTLSELQRRYTKYECGRMQPLLWSSQWSTGI